MSNFEKWMNDQFAPWVVTMVLGTNFIILMLILGDLVFGRL